MKFLKIHGDELLIDFTNKKGKPWAREIHRNLPLGFIKSFLKGAEDRLHFLNTGYCSDRGYKLLPTYKRQLINYKEVNWGGTSKIQHNKWVYGSVFTFELSEEDANTFKNRLEHRGMSKYIVLLYQNLTTIQEYLLENKEIEIRDFTYYKHFNESGWYGYNTDTLESVRYGLWLLEKWLFISIQEEQAGNTKLSKEYYHKHESILKDMSEVYRRISKASNREDNDATFSWNRKERRLDCTEQITDWSLMYLLLAIESRVYFHHTDEGVVFVRAYDVGRCSIVTDVIQERFPKLQIVAILDTTFTSNSAKIEKIIKI